MHAHKHKHVFMFNNYDSRTCMFSDSESDSDCEIDLFKHHNGSYTNTKVIFKVFEKCTNFYFKTEKIPSKF